MKKALIIFIIILIEIAFKKSFAQTDSIDNNSSNVKQNNIQTNLLGVGGYFSLQYERALNKDFSVSLIGNYINPFFNNSKPTETYLFYFQGRYYLDKNIIPNNGLYLAINLGYLHSIKHYNNVTPSIIQEKRYPLGGIGIGYQFFLKNRIVLDANVNTFIGKGQIKTSNNNLGWHKMADTEGINTININIGYLF